MTLIAIAPLLHVPRVVAKLWLPTVVMVVGVGVAGGRCSGVEVPITGDPDVLAVATGAGEGEGEVVEDDMARFRSILSATEGGAEASRRLLAQLTDDGGDEEDGTHGGGGRESPANSNAGTLEDATDAEADTLEEEPPTPTYTGSVSLSVVLLLLLLGGRLHLLAAPAALAAASEVMVGQAVVFMRLWI